MAEIITIEEIKSYDYESGKLKKCKPKDVYDIELSSVSELVELANTLGAKIIYQMGKEFLLRHKGLLYYAKQ
ncbi:MAG: hypothetical protein ACFFDN_15115 [Candidatus Hodarchaeota archaeon]